MKISEQQNKKLVEENKILKNLKNFNDKLRDKLNKNLILRSKREIRFKRKQIRAKVYEILGPIFTEGQIRKLLHPGQNRVMWSTDDISTAIALRSVSPKGYAFLRRKKNYPLPALSTLRKYASNVKLEQGVIQEAMTVMKLKSKNVTSRDRLCSLFFDEIHLSGEIEIDRKNEQRVGPAKTAQVGMIRGLASTWKQPVYYKYDQKLTKTIIEDVIGQLYDAGYTVVSLTTDMRTSNIAVWNDFNIGIDNGNKNYFVHLRDHTLKIFVFADPPHFHFVDSGFHVNNKHLKKDVLEELLTFSGTDYKLNHNLKSEHLNVKYSERQRVSPACKVFSNNVSDAVSYLATIGVMKSANCMQILKLLKLVNDWFDVFNSKTYSDIPYGFNLTEQIKILNEMSSYFKNLRAGNHLSLIPFQKGVIFSNNSLQELYIYLKEKYPQEMINNRKQSYIFTNRLNQDVLENFFGYIRSMGAVNVRPSALQFKHRLRWYILAKHSKDLIVNNHNSEEDGAESLVTISDGVGSATPQEDDDNEYVEIENGTVITEIMGECFDSETEIHEPEVHNIDDCFDENGEEIEEEIFECSDSELMQKIRDIIQEEALIYVAGYVAYCFRHKYSFLRVATKNIAVNNIPPWVCHVSKGYFNYPSCDLIQVGKINEEVFQKFHGNFL